MNGLRGLRVLMTADALGGVWVYALDLARGLAAEGCSVTLAVLGPAPPEEARAAARDIPDMELVALGIPPDWLSPDRETVRAGAERLARMAGEIGADLVHLNNPAFLALADFGRPVVAVAHSCLLTWWRAMRGDAPLPPDFAWQAELTAQGYARADAVIAPSRAFARATATAYGLPVLPDVVLNGRASAAPPIPQPVCGTFVFTAGRLWDEGKNIRLLEEVAKHVDLPVLAAGASTGPNGSGILLQRVRALGRLDAAGVATRLRKRPIYVAPALYEPFGLAVLEAAQHACSLVISDIPSFRELWDGAALFATPYDPAAFAGAITSLATDPDQAEALGAVARARSDRYTDTAMSAGTAAIYRRVLGRQPARLAS